MSLLAGVFLAFTWSSLVAPRKVRSGPALVAINVVGIVALAGLIVMVLFTTGFSDFPYRGGIALTSVLSALLIMALVVPGTLVDRLFALKPLVWIGKISYGMYLCHTIVLALVSSGLRSALGTGLEGTLGIWTTPLQIVCTALGTFIITAIFSTLVQRIPRFGKWIIG